MLFSLLLTRKSTLPYFFLFIVILSNFLIILVVKEKIKVKLALAIAAGAPVTVVKEMKILHDFMQKEQLKFCLCNQMQVHIYLLFYCLTSFFNFLAKIIFNLAYFI